MLRKIALSVSLLLALVSCNRPEKIPEEELQSIIKDVFLTNAYASVNYQFNADSVSYYEPILEDHGYTIADFKYTMYKLSLLKSSRITEIFDMVIADLEKEFSTLEYRRNILDTVDQIIRNRYLDTLYVRDTTVRIRDLGQMAKADFKVAVVPGEFKLTYNYMIDSTDKSTGYRMSYNFLDQNDSVISVSQRYYSRVPRAPMLVDFVVSSDKVKKLQVKFLEFIGTERAKPNVGIDSIRLTYTLPIAESRQRILDEYLNNSLKQLLKNGKNQKDSVTNDTIPPYSTYKMRHPELRRVGTPAQNRTGAKH